MSPILFLLLLAQQPASHEVFRSSVQSEALGGEILYNVILPEDYAKSRRRYPVLYLLHGLTGHYSDWGTRTNVAEYVRGMNLIVVMPDGGDRWYVNSQLGKQEDHIIKELIPRVDGLYRTIPLRGSRAIAGLSMGGYGALLLGLKYPRLFAFAGSFSGAVAVPQTDSKRAAEVFGAMDNPLRKENDLLELVKTAKPPFPFLYLDCGTEDSLLASNRKLAEALHTAKIPYEYRELPGAHTWDYWDRQVRELLKVMSRLFSL